MIFGLKKFSNGTSIFFMRIVAGKYRGRTLAVLDTSATRPTSDRARESIFNILDSRLRKCGAAWTDLSVLDAFAGTGALGVEAASRGVPEVCFMEKDAGALKALRQNIAPLEKDGCQIAVFPDVLAPPQAGKTPDLVFMDPPYRKGLVGVALAALSERGWIGEKTVCVIETERNETPDLPAGLIIRETREYGKAKVIFASFGDPFFAA